MTETLTEEFVIEKPRVDEDPASAPQEEVDRKRLRKPAPPKKGLCRRCGEDKPINRLMLCYPCWVKSELEKDGWREGMPHPEHCGCSGIGGHETRRSEGN
jgi:hypothetical protein